MRIEGVPAASAALGQAALRARALAASLPTNRAYLDALRADRQNEIIA